MKVSEIETWARSLANLASSQAIAHSDVDSSVNMAWKDVYARLLERDDDFWTKEQLFASVTAYATSNPNEYKIPLPSDFYKLRFVDYLGATSGQWRQMHKFPLSMRNDQPSDPHYRFDGTNLWVVGANLSQVRVHYYPPPAQLTHPDPDLVYGTGITPNNFSLITSPVWAPPYQTCVYIYNAQTIQCESVDKGTVGTPVVLLAVGANVSNLVYYKGYLYWIQAGNVRRAPTDLASTLVPAAIISTGAVTVFGIFKNLIYYNDGGTLKTANLDGSSPASLGAIAATSVAVAGGVVYYVLAGALKSVSPVATLVASGVSAVQSDGTNLYYLDTVGQLHQAVMSSTPAITTDTVMRSDVAALGPWAGALASPGTTAPNDRLPILTGEGQQLLAASAYVDTDVSYPSNIPVEIVAVQAGIDFCSKLGKDFSALRVRLGDPNLVPATGLWASFFKLAKRDEYEPERIKNSRALNSGLAGMM